ncbi:MAG: insulinase family protein [bacterium]|nr:insulinase family protein [Candidatus Minthenecus merdequi]
MDTKTATNSLTMSGYDIDYTLDNVIMAELMEKILDTRYLEAIREKEGGTYGVSVWCFLAKYNEPHLWMDISFDTDPDKQNHLLDIIYDEIEKIIKEGPLESDLAKAKEIMIKDYERESRYNFTMMSHLQDYYKNGFNYGKDYINTVNSITGEEIRLMLKKLYEQRNIIEAVLMPARN